jgi:hypothetical protein
MHSCVQCFYQCGGSVTFWYGSGSADPDPRIRTVPLTYESGFGSGSGSFRQGPSICQQKIILFMKVLFRKAVEIKVFLAIFCLMMKGSGYGSTTLVKTKEFQDI